MSVGVGWGIKGGGVGCISGGGTFHGVAHQWVGGISHGRGGPFHGR